MPTPISPEELNVFRTIPLNKKIDSMTLYLIGDGGTYKYNMADVGEHVFRDRNYSQTVSLIHRCYNFSGRNGGAYRPGCSFEKKYGYRVTRADVEAFLRQFPNGTFQSSMTFEQFLTSRVKARQSKQPKQTAPRNRQTSSSSSFEPVSGEELALRRKICLVTTLILVAILAFLALTGGLFRHWVISLLCAMMLCGMISMIKEL